MAGTLGGLVVTLGLNAAEFTAGLTKSEYEARKFAQKFDRAIADGAKAAGAAFVALGAAAVGAFAAISKLASDVGAFKDLEETTGANAEALASFAVAAGTAGVEMATVAGAMNKLTKGLVSVEDETKDAGAALGALGLDVKKFKELDPATQMEEVAKALAQFEDGAGKTAVAMALFGKSGAALLPFLKELAAEGGRQVILTQQQIERADAYADAQARTRTQLQLYVQMLATELLPTITTVTEVARDFIKGLIGIREEGERTVNAGEAVRAFAEGVALAFAKVVDVGDAVVRVFRVVAEAAAAYAAQRELSFFDFQGRADIAADARKRIDAILTERTATDRLTEAFKKADEQRRLAAREDRGFRPPGRRLAFEGKEDAGKKAKEQVTEAQRYIEALEKQIVGTQELSAVELARVEIAKFKKAATADEEQRIFALAAELDLQRAIKKEEEERKKAEQEAARAREQTAKLQQKVIDDEFKAAEALRQENDRIKEHIVLLTGGEEAVRALEKARVASAIAIKEETLAMLQNAGADQLQIAAIREQITALRERQGLLASVDLAEQYRIEVEKMQNLKDSFSDALVTPLMDFVNQTKSAKDAFKSFINSIQQLLQEKAARSLADYIFGGKTGGGFDLGTFFKWLSDGFGGFGGGTSYLPGVTDMVPPVFGGFALGGVSPGGRAWVGEDGPELLTLPRGARITPHAQSVAMTERSLVFNVNVMPGADTRSAKQAGGLLRDTVLRSLRER